MKTEVNIWKSIKTMSLVAVVLLSFVAKGMVQIPDLQTKGPNFQISAESNTNEAKTDFDDKGNKESGQDSKSEKEEHLVADWSFEATLSFFTVVFDDFTGFIPAKIQFVPTVDYPVDTCSDSNIKVLATRYFRVLFAKILPINAP